MMAPKLYASPRESVTRGLLQRALHFVMPACCLSCGDPVLEPRDSLGLCPACRRRLVRWPRHGCASCGRPLEAVDLPEGYRCGPCRQRATPYDALLSAWSYQPPIDDVLTGLKFRRLEYLGSQLARALAERFRHRLGSCDLVVPVPLHWWRYLRRGYNQAAAIARPLAAELRLPVERVLRRRRATAAQSRLSRAARRRNLRDAFSVRRRVLCAGRRILLVDDVATTGTTLEAAARCLLQSGALSVTALTAARTPDEPIAQESGRDIPLATLRVDARP